MTSQTGLLPHWYYTSASRFPRRPCFVQPRRLQATALSRYQQLTRWGAHRRTKKWQEMPWPVIADEDLRKKASFGDPVRCYWNDRRILWQEHIHGRMRASSSLSSIATRSKWRKLAQNLKYRARSILRKPKLQRKRSSHGWKVKRRTFAHVWRSSKAEAQAAAQAARGPPIACWKRFRYLRSLWSFPRFYSTHDPVAADRQRALMMLAGPSEMLKAAGEAVLRASSDLYAAVVAIGRCHFCAGTSHQYRRYSCSWGEGPSPSTQ